MSQSELLADFITLSDLEQAVDRDYLPPLTAVAALYVEAPGTFELTTGNHVTLNPENVENCFSSVGLARDIHSRGLSLKTEKRDILQLLIHPDSPPQTLWSVLRVCDNSMLTGDAELQLELDLVNGTEGLATAQIAPGTRFLYVRSFAVPVQTMREMLDDWSEDDSIRMK